MRPRTALLGALGGVLLLALDSSPRWGGGLPPLLSGGGLGEPPRGAAGWAMAVVPVVATAAGLCLTRFWPYLLAVAAVLTVPHVLLDLLPNTLHFPVSLYALTNARGPLIVIGVLAAAQQLFRAGAVAQAAAVAGLALGGRLLGSAMAGASWLSLIPALTQWHVAMLIAALVALAPSVRPRSASHPPSPPPPAVPGGRAGSPRTEPPGLPVRAIVAAVVATFLALPLSYLTTARLAALLDVSQSAIYRHGYAAAAVSGAFAVALVLICGAVAGRWALAGLLAAATVQVALVAPTILALATLYDDSTRWLTGLAGVAAGVAVTLTRWRTVLAGALTVAAATAMFIAFAATTGNPAKIAEQRQVIPAVLLLVVVAAAATAVTGCTAVALAPRGLLPAVLGPLTTVLAAGGLRTVQVTYVGADGLPESSYLNPVGHLTTSAVLMLAAGAALGGLMLVRQYADRRAERLRTEQIQREAAAAERDRLARPIHDGVLQVLALVQRHGAELGGDGGRLAAMAGEQEVALRSLLSGRQDQQAAAGDLRAALLPMAAPAVEVAAPAGPVPLPGPALAELVAAVRAALDNAARHAGPGARAWILLEDEQTGVRVTVRDDGTGFAAGRLAEAAAAGRLGVAQSMRGRIADLGGRTTVHSRPGEGTEVEFWVPR